MITKFMKFFRHVLLKENQRFGDIISVLKWNSQKTPTPSVQAEWVILST